MEKERRLGWKGALRRMSGIARARVARQVREERLEALCGAARAGALLRAVAEWEEAQGTDARVLEVLLVVREEVLRELGAARAMEERQWGAAEERIARLVARVEARWKEAVCANSGADAGGR